MGLLALAFVSAGLLAGGVKPKNAAQSDRFVSNGYRYMVRGGAKKSLKFFQKAVKFDETNVQAWAALADAYTQLGKADDAADALDKAGLKAVPKGQNYSQLTTAARYSAQGYNLLVKGDEARAAHYFKAALTLQPGYAHAKAGLALAKDDGKDEDLKDEGKDDEKDDADDDEKPGKK
jgi:tetratricopeptide (TPR) repeat protein